MQYNSEATNQDLVSLLNDLTGMDNNVYPLTAKTRDMNRANRQIWSWIHEAYGGWLYDDSNGTDFPTALTTLTSAQKDYTLPSSALTVRGVEIMLNGSTVWQKLFPKTEEQIREIMAEKQFESTSAVPLYYTPYANSFKIYPASNYTQASSLRISYDRGSSAFTTTDTTKTPGFASEFHEAVAVGGGFYFSTYKTIPQKNDLTVQWQDYEKRIKSYYGKRYKELFPSRMTVRDYVSENQ
jgi:hypothetical protein